MSEIINKRIKYRSLMKMKFFLSSFIMLSFCSFLQSQTAITPPYYCGFEDSTEVSKWVLNYGPQGALCEDRWVVGSEARNEGRKGLYISTDGYSPKFGQTSNIVTAYREFSVPTQIPYDISFDWKSNGKAGTSDLYVFFIQPNDITPLSNASSANIPTTSVIKTYRATAMNDKSQWQSHSFQQTLRANIKYKLLFVWVNSNKDTTIVNPVGACIDNLQITSTNCAKPYDFTIDASCDTTWISWLGTSSYYEVEYKSRNNLNWRKLGIQSSTKTYLTNLSEGLYDFRVRGICSEDTSAYITNNSSLIYCPERHCINYVNLTDTSTVSAFYGTVKNPDLNQGVIDFGPNDKLSRHTVNWTQDEFDPRTGNHLRKVPEDEFASVRLGNWNSGSEAESLYYNYIVDSTSSILLLKYAIVLQDPSHSEIEQPRFFMQILDEFGDIIDPTCGQADFYADKTRPGWNTEGDVTWKDWTTAGLNLSAYSGRKLTIKLTTYDCSLGAHYGYAYFALNCASASIETTTCGDNPYISVNAPEGFNYTWTNPDYPDSIWTTRNIDISATDTTTFYCEVCYKEEKSCCFTLSTTVYPRFPIADLSYEYVVENCQNILRFKNKSHVMTRDKGKYIHTSEPCESYYWDFDNGRSSSFDSPELICSSDGETLNVTLTAYLSGGKCSKDTTFKIIIPQISQTVDTTYHSICQGDFYTFGKYFLMQGGVYSDTLTSKLTGCDSITVLKLTVNPTYDMPVVKDTICYGEQYFWNGKNYKTTSKIESWLKSQYGCDSIVSLDLTVLDDVTFNAIPTDVLNGPNSGRIDIVNAPQNYTYSVNGTMNGFLTGLSGGEYTIIVYNSYGCASKPTQVTITQNCLKLNIDSVPYICGNDSYFEMNYSISGNGYPTAYDVKFSDNAKKAGFTDLLSQKADGKPIRIILPNKTRPDIYDMDIVFEDLLCDSIHNPKTFTVNYQANVISQKWNDVLAVLNSTYNGGYDFSAFQWYKNGDPIIGETSSYLYLPETGLDTNVEYSVQLTRTDDGKSLFTCTFIPIQKAKTSIYPTMLQRTELTNLNLAEAATVAIYNSMGRKQNEIRMAKGNGQKLFIADKAGYYFVSILYDNGETHSFKVILN